MYSTAVIQNRFCRRKEQFWKQRQIDTKKAKKGSRGGENWKTFYITTPWVVCRREWSFSRVQKRNKQWLCFEDGRGSSLWCEKRSSISISFSISRCLCRFLLRLDSIHLVIFTGRTKAFFLSYTDLFWNTSERLDLFYGCGIWCFTR